MNKSFTGASHLNFTMGSLVLAQGIHQFMSSGSIPAVGMGLVIGGIYSASGMLINQNDTLKGHALGAGISLALSGRMASYVIKTGVYMTPRGIMAGLATAAGIYNTLKFLEEYS